ncbi:MAG: TatD family hydrolase [Candidatus Pacebacteria bacterium]|nr:TatD family hydrolase [Candidatus Paceibacterota bacterium]
MVQVIDTHCHYNMEPLYSGKKSHFRLNDDEPILSMTWQQHWHNAQQKEVGGGVVVGANMESSLKAVEIASLEPKLIAAIGIHPHEAEAKPLAEYEQFLTKLLPNNNIKAIGETGLDYFRLNKNTSEFHQTKQAQHQLFALQIKLAKQQQLPLIIHVRDDQELAYWETLDILKQHHDADLKFVLHCVSGPTKYVEEALTLGAYLGFDGNISYKNTDDLKKILKATPQDKILIETDAPYLPPQGYRGQICEPWMVTEVAKFITENFEVDLDQVLTNTKKFFSYQF